MEKIPETRPIKVACGIKGCGCRSFKYIPKNGSQSIRCTKCKHVADDHGTRVPHKCKKDCNCPGFYSSFTCGCGEPTHAHFVSYSLNCISISIKQTEKGIECIETLADLMLIIFLFLSRVRKTRHTYILVEEVLFTNINFL